MQLIHTIYEPSGTGPFPTILTLHGRGANAFDLLGLAPFLCGGRFLIICPQGPLETPLGPGAVGYSWYPLSMGGPPDIAAMMSSRQKLQQFVNECLTRYPVDPKRLVVLGFSQGGVMAYGLSFADPQCFAALVALSTWLPQEFVPATASEKTLQIPALVQHGTNDPLIQVGRARGSVEKLRDLQVPVTYREYEMGHEISPKSLNDLSAWLEEKVFNVDG